MKNLTPEMIEKAKTAKSAEELLALAKENNVEMTADEAKTYFAQLGPKSGELDDDDLDAVAGGACTNSTSDIVVGSKVRVINGYKCPKCGGTVGYIVAGEFQDCRVYCQDCNHVIITTVTWFKVGVDIEPA